jgi:hypothetical protein
LTGSIRGAPASGIWEAGAGVTLAVGYDAPAHASGTISAGHWARGQSPPPRPAGATDLGLTASWTVRYGNGSAFADGPGPGAYASADDTFSHVSLGSITTTRLRVVMQSGAGSAGLIQWVTSGIPVTQ